MALRRLQSVVLKEEDDFDDLSPTATEPEPAPGPEPESQKLYVRTPAYTGPERRKADRRGMDALRAEALRTVMSQVEDRNFGGLRDRSPWRGGLKASRVALLLVAVLAGGLAAYLATQREPTAAPAVAEAEPVVVVAPTTPVLVALQPVAVGDRLSAASLSWTDWPDTALRPEYITETVAPDAIARMTGFIARSEILPGEPIREEKLVPAAGGYLSAVLGSGMRAVSVEVMAHAASGGFVLPNDRVDVILTRASDTGQTSETIVTNVRVLAVNSQLGEAGAETATAASTEGFSGMAIATLELDAIESQIVVAAVNMGQLSLVLRSALDATAARAVEELSVNRAIRLTSPFWQ